MTKSQLIDPKNIRKSSWLEFQPIPLNQYDKTFPEERMNFSDGDLISIYREMQYIREFETMLQAVRTTKQYNGVPYTYTGPAHLSLGQEASAVGMAWNLDENDHIFGSHRSHGEVLAKGFTAIRKLPDEKLTGIMSGFNKGQNLDTLLKQGSSGDTKSVALDFLIYGFMAELFGRTAGFSKGLGNSMHVFFTPFGIYPNNAIVGGSAGIATGAALYKRVSQKPGVIVCNIGDGSLGCGPVWEAMNFAAMDQLVMLWEEGHRGGLPVIFNFINNQYAMGGQTAGETMAFHVLARVGAGIEVDQMHAERIDGLNPLAVIDGFKRKIQIVQQNRGPVLLDTLTYRSGGHSTTDGFTYRTQEEMELWKEFDCIDMFKKNLKQAGILSEDDFVEIEGAIRSHITRIMQLATSDQISPRVNMDEHPDWIRDFMFSNQDHYVLSDAKPDVLIPMEQNPRLQKIASKSRFALDADGSPVSSLKTYTIRDALFEAILDKFYSDATLIAYGEDNRDWGGAFGVYGGLTESLPYYRFFNSPISESAIVSTAVGYAISGGRALPELMYCDFLGRAGDEVFNQMAKWQSMSAGELKCPMVLRVSVGSKYGAQHAQDWSSLTAHIPGLKVCYPVTPYDARGLMSAALSGSDPVVFFESQKLYDKGEFFHQGGVPEEYYEIPLGLPDIKVKGSDITILTIGASLYPAVDAAKQLKDAYGISAEVIDARSLVPFDYELLLESVKKTGKVVLVSEACERGSYISNIASNITQFAFNYLDAPPVVVGAPNFIAPCPELDHYYYPQADWILDAIHEKIQRLPDYTAMHNFTTLEKMKREREGV